MAKPVVLGIQKIDCSKNNTYGDSIMKIDPKWKELNSLSDNTGQGKLSIVVPSEINNIKDIDKSQKYVYKKLKQQGNLVRRARMYREVSCLKSLKHPNIISVIDTNVEKYEDLDCKLFFVTPYIEGKNLDEFIKLSEDLSLDQIINSFVKLLDTIAYCHEENIIHRDIKPDNIMCFNNDINNLILIDFGLSFNQDEQNITPTSEHLGNRFLYLPELQNGNKTDKRSDITQLCGILFFMLTKKYPVNLQNEKDEMPHQRKDTKDYFAKMFKNNQLDKIYKIFDQAFQININERYQTIDSLKLDVENILNNQDNVNTSLEQIEIKLNQNRYLKSSKIIAEFKTIHEEISQYIMFFIDSFKEKSSVLAWIQTGYNQDFQLLQIQNTIGVKNQFDNKEIRVKYLIKYIGNEMIIQLTSDEQSREVLRCKLDDYNQHKSQMFEIIKEYYIEKINNIL